MAIDAHAIMSVAISGISVLATSVSGGYFTQKGQKSNWYHCIKPRITPPSIVFPIVWTILYVGLFIAFANVIHEKQTNNIILIGLSLSLNIIWTFLYFAKRYVTLAAVVVYAMILLAIMIVMVAFWSKNKLVAYIVIPYALWLCFAATLNTMSMRRIKVCNVTSEEERKSLHK